ncbi:MULTISPECIES: MHYT domain-containing protein [unclassified Brevundimonas]|uniref:MHYT domain-containing protein n=1 Tax=unclassified Brevundimonas TaxID=2622653 RepID=UPI003F8DF796
MRIVDCLTSAHNPALVALAALICILGSWITVSLLKRVRHTQSGTRAAWVFLGALAGGATVWCTHFVSMLAYEPGVQVAYEPDLTGLSLLVAIVGCGAALVTVAQRPRAAAVLGGLLFGLTVAGMHFIGMAAFAVDAAIEWSWAYVVAAVAGSLLFGALSFHLAVRATDTWERWQAIACMVLGIVVLHFTAMAALTITPFAPIEGAPTGNEARHIIAISVAGVGLWSSAPGWPAMPWTASLAIRPRPVCSI